MKKLVFVSFLSLLPWLSAPGRLPIPEVEFLIVRLDFQSLDVKGYFHFTAPYRKILAGDAGQLIGDNLVFFQPAGDFGSTRIVSRLTGERIYEASTVWSGMGRHDFPPESLMVPPGGELTPVSNPLAIDYFTPHGYPAASHLVWPRVRKMREVVELSQRDNYEVLAYLHFYSVGMSDPSTAEWIVIINTKPAAPRDVGVVSFDWPQGFLTSGGEVSVELSVHNFSDVPEAVRARLKITRGDSVVYDEPQSAASLPGDSTGLFVFPPWAVQASPGDTVVCEATLEIPAGDAFADNDTLRAMQSVTGYPTFRSASSLSSPGFYPLFADPADLDGDGDVDFFIRDYHTKILLNEGDSLVDLDGPPFDTLLKPWSRLGFAGDLTGDSIPDLLILSDHFPLRFVRGDGGGAFTDATDSSGITLAAGCCVGEAAVVDIDGDLDRDLVFPTHTGLFLYENDGRGRFEDVSGQSGIGYPVQLESAAAGDVNNDGASDLFLVGWDLRGDGTHHRLYLNDGSGVFTPRDGPWSDNRYGRDALIVDVDNDGLNDIYVSNTPVNGTAADRLYRNTGDATYTDVTAAAGIGGGSFSVNGGDCNGDGFQDLLVDPLFSPPRLLVNDGGGNFFDGSFLLGRQMFLFGSLGSSGNPRFLDLNGDGDLDIYSAGEVYVNMTVPDIDRRQVKIVDTPPGAGTPAGFTLFQNFPNPFNPTTQIRYTLQRQAFVTIRIFNILGQEMATLVQTNQGPGSYAVEWDAAGVPSGVYVYRLQADGSGETKKMVVLK